MSKPGEDLRKKRSPNQEEIFGKRDVQTRRRSSEKETSKPTGDPQKKRHKGASQTILFTTYFNGDQIENDIDFCT